MRKIPLSPMDYYFFRRELYTIQFVFEYLGQLDEKVFERNLRSTAEILSALSARLRIASDKEIYLESGPPLAVTTCRLQTEPDPDIMGAELFLDPVQNIEGKPLVKVLLTHTPTRTFIGFSFSHLLGDGTSFFQFMSILSRISLSQEVRANPSNRRELLQVESGKTPKSFFDATGYIFPRPPGAVNYKTETIRYSLAELTALKKKYSRTGASLSSNHIVMADLAARFHSSIPLHEGKFIIRCPVDYRKAYDLPSEYFGNAVRDALAVFTPNEIQVMELSDIAQRIRQAIQAIDKQSVLDSLDSLNELRRKHGIGIFEQVGCPGLLVSNLSKFPIHSTDFGLGPPIAFHHASLNPRLALVLPLRDGVEVRFKRPID